MYKKRRRVRTGHYLKATFKDRGLPVINELNKDAIFSFESRLKVKKRFLDILATHNSASGVVEIGFYQDIIPHMKRHDVQRLIDSFNAKHRFCTFKICPDHHVAYMEGAIQTIHRSGYDKNNIERLMSKLIYVARNNFPAIRRLVLWNEMQQENHRAVKRYYPVGRGMRC